MTRGTADHCAQEARDPIVIGERYSPAPAPAQPDRTVVIGGRDTQQPTSEARRVIPWLLVCLHTPEILKL